jgi:hypothetical protein
MIQLKSEPVVIHPFKLILIKNFRTFSDHDSVDKVQYLLPGARQRQNTIKIVFKTLDIVGEEQWSLKGETYKMSPPIYLHLLWGEGV